VCQVASVAELCGLPVASVPTDARGGGVRVGSVPRRQVIPPVQAPTLPPVQDSNPTGGDAAHQ
jgi:hypothetical protein